MLKTNQELREEIHTRLVYAGGLKNDQPSRAAINSMHDLIISQRQEDIQAIVEMVEGMKVEVPPEPPQNGRNYPDVAAIKNRGIFIGRNLTLDDLKNKILNL